MKQIANFLLVGLVLIGIVVVYDGFFIVNEGKQVMITQFGKPIGSPKTQAGLYLKVPFLQQVRNAFCNLLQAGRTGLNIFQVVSAEVNRLPFPSWPAFCNYCYGRSR